MYCGAALAPSAAPSKPAPARAPAPAPSSAPAADLPFGPQDTLETAYRKTAAMVRSKGAPLYEPEAVNAQMSSRAFGRQLLIMTPPTPGIIYLCVAPWDEDKVSRAATDLVQAFKVSIEMGFSPSFMILSAHPVPEPMGFLFGNSLPAQLELLVRAQITLPAVVPPELMPDLASKLGAGLLEKITGQKPDLSNLTAVGTIQRAILEQLRPEKDPEKALPEGSSAPEALLLCLGALFGEVLRRSGFNGRWITHDLFPFSVALDVKTDKEGEGMTANPVGKVMKLYRNGREDDLLFFTKLLQEKTSTRLT